MSRRSFFTAMLSMVFLLLVSMISAQTFYVVNSQSRTLSRIDPSTDSVNNNFSSLGNVPNKMVVDSDYIWVVNSGDNAVQKISRLTGQSLANIFVGPGANPWDAVRDQEFLYVTGLFSSKVYKINTLTGTVVSSIFVGASPEALLVVDGKLYVTNTGNYAENYAGSSVSVIDLESFTVTATIPVHANPQYLASYGGKLHVSCTGNWTDIGGAICIIDLATGELEETIDLGGTPGCIWIGEGQAYVGDSSGLVLYSYDPDNLEIIHGATNPISNGGSEILGTDSMIAILKPNWSANGTLKILHTDLSAWQQYNVAMMPTDLKMWAEPSSNAEELVPNLTIQVYPNPIRMGNSLHFEADKPLQAKLQIFNLRGQLISSDSFEGKAALELNRNLPSGIYLYRVSEGAKIQSSGRFVVYR